MENSEASEHFVRLLTEHQNRLFGYVYSLLGDFGRTSDVVQETNLVLWRKLAEFDSARPFLPWAFAVARMQVMAHLRDHRRDRLLLDSGLAERVAEISQKQADGLAQRQAALRHCVEKLNPEHREMILGRYKKALSVKDLAEAAGRTTGAVKVALLRIRRQLGECVERQLAAAGENYVGGE